MILALGAVAAVTASALFSLGLILQSLEARTVPHDHALRLSLIRQLLGRPRWVVGAALMVLGFGLHVIALLFAPLTVVQPALAAGLVVLLVAGARTEGEPVGTRERTAVVALSLGVVALTLTSPERTIASPDAVTLVLVLGALAGVAVLPVVLAHQRPSGLMVTIGAGAAYSLTGLTTKLLSDAASAGDVGLAALWLVVTAVGAMLALLDQTTGLQRQGATKVGVTIYVMPVVVPVLLAPVLVGEAWSDSPGGGLPLAVALAVVCAGAAALSTSRQVVAQERASPLG